MKTKFLPSIGLLLATAFLLACSCGGSGFPFNLLATSTPTPIPTATPTPTPLPTPTPSINLGTRITIPQGGFSFRPVIGYEVEAESDTVYITSPDQHVITMFAGTYDTSASNDLNQVSQDFLDVLRSDMPDMITNPSWNIFVGGTQALATDLSGTLNGAETRGRIVVAIPYDNQYFFAICLTNGASYWESEGRAAFEAMLGSVTFFSLR
ncbi:MAG: hypothetical protein ABWK53_05980 [Anaerolineales bacterium]